VEASFSQNGQEGSVMLDDHNLNALVWKACKLVEHMGLHPCGSCKADQIIALRVDVALLSL